MNNEVITQRVINTKNSYPKIEDMAPHLRSAHDMKGVI